MMKSIYLKNGNIVNEGRIFKGNILIRGEKIIDIDEGASQILEYDNIKTIDIEGKYIFPGIIDSHVHFRQPGMIYKGDIFTESKAAVAGGITSVMEMPNTDPQTTFVKALEDKIRIAEDNCFTNYAFYLGATGDNLDELISADSSYIPGVKLFMGASTGNMLINNTEKLVEIFGKLNKLIAVHSEDEDIIQYNLSKAIAKYGDNIPINIHPLIRSREACYSSTQKAVDLACRHDSRLHLLHLSTKEEIDLLFEMPCDTSKQITAEACIHHLWFTDNDYDDLNSLIKWNPAIKTSEDRQALLNSINSNKVDVISTDHAPHTFEEKQHPYTSCPSGAPMVQHSLPVMLELFHNNQVSLEVIAEKMCHNPAKCFNVKDRGFIRKGYFADLSIVDLDMHWKVSKSNILYKCGWSPLDNQEFNSKVIHTFVNGKHIYNNEMFDEVFKGKLLEFL